MKTIASEAGSASALPSTLSGRLESFLSPLLVRPDQMLDRRLAQTFAATLSILLEQRYRASGPAGTPKQIWQVVFAYARRWQIEMAFRSKVRNDSCHGFAEYALFSSLSPPSRPPPRSPKKTKGVHVFSLPPSPSLVE